MLNFLKSDTQLCSATDPEPQESLADAVQKAFGHLIACLKHDLHQAMPPMLDGAVTDNDAARPCLEMLTEAMTLLRYCRVNAALTIQLFSQLFHYMNMYLFNWLMSREGSSYCCRAWGIRLANRLGHVQSWAERQGLELAADCHLSRIVQVSKHILFFLSACHM